MVDFLNKMKSYSGNDVIVVMVDGRALKGKLTDVGKDYMVLENVYETDNVEITWKDIDNRKVGFAKWKKVNLPEVTINLQGILRVWPYIIKETEEKKVEEEVPKKGYGPLVRGEYTLLGDL